MDSSNCLSLEPQPVNADIVTDKIIIQHCWSVKIFILVVKFIFDGKACNAQSPLPIPETELSGLLKGLLFNDPVFHGSLLLKQT
jgi:hypothetical protein